MFAPLAACLGFGLRQNDAKSQNGGQPDLLLRASLAFQAVKFPSARRASAAIPGSDHGVTQLACRGEATILHRDNDSLFGIEGRANLPSVRIAQPRARRAARDE